MKVLAAMALAGEEIELMIEAAVEDYAEIGD